jgi:Fuc2NAc and GlcNAc transferase
MNISFFSALIFLVALFCSTGLTRCVIWLARRASWEQAVIERSSHVVPTLTRGGVGFAATILVGFLGVFGVSDGTGWVIGGALAVAVVGFVDDAVPIRVASRVFVHLFAVSTGLFGLWPNLVGFPVFEALPVLFFALSVLFLLWAWFINLFNFMDGIDGIAAAEVVFIGVAGALLSVVGGHSELASAWALLAGACLGFLVWNAPPARIFMGNVGSGFLGFIVAALLLLSVIEGVMSPWVALLLVATFIGDATVTLLRRMWRGERWYEGHRQHAYQHLAIRWGSHGKVTSAYTIFNLVVLAPAAWLASHSPELALPITIATLTLVTAIVLWAGGGAAPASTRQGDPSV